MTRLARLTALATLAAGLLPAQALAAIAADDPFADFETVARSELGDLRGGMMINGIPVDFAVVIKSTVEGALAASGLQTLVKVNDQGGLGSVTTTPIGTEGIMANDSGGVAMTLDGGTSILHQVIDNQVQTLIANTMDKVNITHQTQLNVTLPGFTNMARTYFAHSHVSSLNRDSGLVGLGRF